MLNMVLQLNYLTAKIFFGCFSLERGMMKIKKIFGKNVLDDKTLKRYMPQKSYNEYIRAKINVLPLSQCCAKAVAKAIKKWAGENGASHYTHWFMPLNNKTAGKRVSFIEMDAKGGVFESFNERDLIKGETDASSFPNGGERLTFEARGYTVWDYTSPIFIKEDSNMSKTVYIPTAFCSYNGTALDEKTPLLKASQALNSQVVKLLNKLGYKDVVKAEFNVGVEQEYFLINSDILNKRIDLRTAGRVLLGAKPLKSQEQNLHYFGKIEKTVSEFMNEVNCKLWQMGVMAKLQHKEVAPCQYEFVPIFNNVNMASDQNQVVMEILGDIAQKYGLTAIFHEKPFDYMNGSGKHENWSINTNTGLNLFNVNLKDRLLFATFFISMMVAIDEYYPVLRQSTAYYANDLRLGGSEAPPTIISMFASEYVLKYVDDILNDNIVDNKNNILNIGVNSLPAMERDYCDRNRTSPFAFTGNKFEFRMPGSSQSVAWPATCACTILADVLMNINEKLEGETDVRSVLKKILIKMFKKHNRIIFNGNGYDVDWKNEAEKRGLIDYKNTISTFNVLDSEKTISLFKRTSVLNEEELILRKNNSIKAYYSNLLLDAKTLIYMLDKEVFPVLENSFNQFHRDEILLAKTVIANNYKKLANMIKSFNQKSDDEKQKASIKIMNLMENIRNGFNSIENFVNFAIPNLNEILN